MQKRGNFLKQLRNIYYKEIFNPGILGMLTSFSYIVRRALYREIKAYSKYMRGVCLDFGCGRMPYRHLFDVDEYIGLDIAGEGHDHVDEAIDVFYDGKKIPFNDNHFDSIFSSEVIEHVFNPDEVLRELYRVLKPGGHMLCTTPFVWDEHEVPRDFARYTSFGLRHIFKNAGFIVVKLTKTTSYIETVFQMICAYINKVVLPKYTVLKILLTPAMIFPFTLFGLILSKLLPDNGYFYHDNVILVKKREIN